MTKVLLVDREDGLLREARDAIERAGFEPTFVTSARAALKLVEMRLYVVVGCDHAVADMTGPDFLSRAAAASPGVGLFLIAASEELHESTPPPSLRGGPMSKLSIAKAQGVRVLLKPYDEGQLVAAITHLARMTEMRRSTTAMTSAVTRPEVDEERPVDRPRSVFPPSRKD